MTAHMCHNRRCLNVPEHIVETFVRRSWWRRLFNVEMKVRRVWACNEHQIDLIGRPRRKPSSGRFIPAVVTDEDMARFAREYSALPDKTFSETDLGRISRARQTWGASTW